MAESVYHYAERRLIWFAPISDPNVLLDGLGPRNSRIYTFFDLENPQIASLQNRPEVLCVSCQESIKTVLIVGQVVGRVMLNYDRVIDTAPHIN